MNSITGNTNEYLKYVMKQAQVNVQQSVLLNTYKSKTNEVVNVLTAIKAIGSDVGVTDIATLKTALANLSTVTVLL